MLFPILFVRRRLAYIAIYQYNEKLLLKISRVKCYRLIYLLLIGDCTYALLILVYGHVSCDILKK